MPGDCLTLRGYHRDPEQVYAGILIIRRWPVRLRTDSVERCRGIDTFFPARQGNGRGELALFDLQISVNRQSGRTLMTLAGELDLASAAALEAHLHEPSTVDRDLVMDLSQLRFIDASGLRLLLAARRGADRRGRRFAVAHTSPSLDRLLALTGAADALGVPEPAV